MGMPVIEPGTSTRCQAITDIITSIALEETALSHILNAEGEKIQKFVSEDSTADYTQILEANNSVRSMVGAITRLEVILQSKLELFADSINEDCE